MQGACICYPWFGVSWGRIVDQGWILQTLIPEIKLEIYTFRNIFSPSHIVSLSSSFLLLSSCFLSHCPLNKQDGMFFSTWTAIKTLHFTKITRKQMFLHWHQTSLSGRIYHWNTATGHLHLPFFSALFFNRIFSYSKSRCLGRHDQVLQQRAQYKDLNRTGCCVCHNLQTNCNINT